MKNLLLLEEVIGQQQNEVSQAGKGLICKCKEFHRRKKFDII